MKQSCKEIVNEANHTLAIN